MSDFRLKVFRSVAQNLSFTKSSQELFISQPAVTKHIKELEAEYGVQLFERQGNRIQLTEAGTLLLKRSERIAEEYKRLEYEMNLLHNGAKGELRLGASTTISQYVLPKALALFSERFPQVKLSMISGNSRDIVHELENHRIDLGLVEGAERLPHLKYTHYLSDELVLVTSAESKWSGKDEISLSELCSIPLVLREHGSGTLEVWERTLLAHHVHLSDLNVLMYLGSTESIKRFLTHADAMGVVSIRAIQDELENGKLQVVEVAELRFMRNFDFVQLQGDENPLAQLFIKNRI